MSEQTKKTSLLDSTFPVLVPEVIDLRASEQDFSRYVESILSKKSKRAHDAEDDSVTGNSEKFAKLGIESNKDDDSFTVVSDPTSSYVDVKMKDSESEPDKPKPTDSSAPSHPFVDALDTAAKSVDGTVHEKTKNKMRTENNAVAYRSTESALLDLFTELEKVTSANHIRELLEGAWLENPLDTLKIIFNARSIHIGKAEKEAFYRSMGWLRLNHPKTLLANLKMLTDPVIEQPSSSKGKSADSDEKTLHENVEEDASNGLAHGYWKDLLALLVLDIHGCLSYSNDPRTILNAKNEQPKTKKPKNKRKAPLKNDKKSTPAEKKDDVNFPKMGDKQKIVAREKRHSTESARHITFLSKFRNNGFYQALHISVARLFATQLSADLALLKSKNKADHRKISLAAKWAPSPEGFHDKHTFIASTIAEILYGPNDSTTLREAYLKKARLHYRQAYLSPLRNALDVVERKISAEQFSSIAYNRVPSVAMNNYKDLFVKKDITNFEKYIDKVAEGKTTISGAILNPGLLVSQVKPYGYGEHNVKKASALLEAKKRAIASKTINAQWDTLVQRIKDSGTLANSIAVCDVSGSMHSPTFPDKTTPMDHAKGLSLLLAEVTALPFGKQVISFSATPKVHSLPTGANFTELVGALDRIDMGFNTNFVSVFEKCILPIARDAKLPKDQMVKQVFVFSDMQFDEAQTVHSYYGAQGPVDKRKWDTTYEYLQKTFAEFGYDMPRLIFWNLAGGRAGYNGSGGDPTAPKPVKSDTPNTALVSGYSQGMLKVFLDGGMFDDDAEEEEEVEGTVVVGKDGEVEKVEKKKKEKKVEDPLAVMKKAIGHESYKGLVVVD